MDILKIRKRIADRAKQIRTELGIKPKEINDMVGISPQVLSNIENYHTKVNIVHLIKLKYSIFKNVSLDSIMFDEVFTSNIDEYNKVENSQLVRASEKKSVYHTKNSNSTCVDSSIVVEKEHQIFMLERERESLLKMHQEIVYHLNGQIEYLKAELSKRQ